MSLQIDQNTAAIVVAIIALVGTIYNANKSSGKLDKDEAVKWENRITKIEQKIEDKLEPLYDVIENELPRLLIKENTPEMDMLLKVGIRNLNEEQSQELLLLVENEYKKVLEDETIDRGRGLGLAFMRAVLKTKIKKEFCK